MCVGCFSHVPEDLGYIPLSAFPVQSTEPQENNPPAPEHQELFAEPPPPAPNLCLAGR